MLSFLNKFLSQCAPILSVFNYVISCQVFGVFSSIVVITAHVGLDIFGLCYHQKYCVRKRATLEGSKYCFEIVKNRIVGRLLLGLPTANRFFNTIKIDYASVVDSLFKYQITELSTKLKK